jgi:hypothetical protein
VALALLLLPWLVALASVRRNHHLDAAAVAVVVTLSVGLPPTWLGWAAYRGPRRSGAAVSGPSMADIADRLAIAVGAQWEAEARVRRLNDPYPLPVSWEAADASLTDAWDSLVKLAVDGVGWPPTDSGTWAAGPDELAGTAGELFKVLAQVPTGRLTVLGEPGAGKTMLMVRLVLDLLARRADGDAVPILASVASWNPDRQDLWNWLGAQLLIDHPALASPPPDGMTEPTQAVALLASGLILPILDGLDEIPQQVRGPAISRINDALRPGEQLVVTCRTPEYREAVRPQDGVEVTLRGAAAVQLRPLDAGTVRGYLSDDAAGPVAKARWAPILAVLGTEAPAGQALSTPLMVGLARAIYNSRPGELARTLRDPAELCSPALADRAAVESLLFDAFIPAAYRRVSSDRWKAHDAERWLVFLARHLDHRIGSTDLAWWQLQDAAPHRTFGLVSGLVAGLGFGLGFGLWVGLRVGLVSGLVAGLGVGSAKAPARGMQMRIRGLLFGLRFGLAFGLALALGFGLWVGLRVGLGVGLMAGIGPGVVAGVVAGVAGVPGDLAEPTSPRAVLARDRQVALLLGLVPGLVAGLVVGLGFGLVSGLAGGLVAALVSGLWVGLVVGLRLSARQTAWPSFMLTGGWLAFHHQLPWALTSFLADAHRRGVLRQAGAVYQFRHIELQHRLANLDANEH